MIEKMLENTDYFKSSLCQWSRDLETDGILTKNEYQELQELMDDDDISTLTYYWKEGDLENRVKWLKSKL